MVTIGVFDGVHLGHRRILDEVGLLATGIGARSVVLTFHPHPATVFRPDEAPQMLTTLEERLELLRTAGIDETVVLRFTAALARQRAEWFTQRVLVDRIGMSRLVIGYDFRFGRGREGNAGYLESLGEKMGFGVDIVPPVTWAGHPISSTRARTALARGDVRAAARVLGRPYSLSGRVVRGEGRGRRLAYPTANLAVARSGKILPRAGIYAVRAKTGGIIYPGALYIGSKPTYGGGATSVEVYLVGRRAGLYGRKVEVLLVDRLRDEQAFRDDLALKRAIAGDVKRVRRLIAN